MGRPRHMDDIEWQEYQMTEEYRQELLYQDDDPYDYDPQEEAYWDFLAEEAYEKEMMWEEEDDLGYDNWGYDEPYEDFHADG